jgi:hypothetical protein
MLQHKKQQLSPEAWISFVKQTKQSIINNPDQYLEKDIPKADKLLIVIDQVFDEVLIHPE